MYNKDNPFYLITTKNNKNDYIYSDERCIAILDINPDNPGHLLIISRGLYTDIYSLPEEHLAHIFVISQKMAIALKKSLGATGVKIIQNNGMSAGQKIYHFHVHLIPYYDNKDQNFLLQKDIEYLFHKIRFYVP